MATQQFDVPAFASPGDPCPTCGTPLAGDQRYCLECGTRRGETRAPLRRRTAERVYAEPPPPGDPRTGLTFLAGLACLLLALGVGVLIGRSGDRMAAPVKAAPAQVISVGGAGAAATTPAASEAAGAAPAKARAKKAKAKRNAASRAKSAKASKATNKSLKSLGGLSGTAYQKKAAKLPKQVGTGGKPPPIDKSKPAGGGSAVESIG